MPNEAQEAMDFVAKTAAQPLTKKCRELKVGHVLTPEDVDDLRESANWMEGASIVLAANALPD